ncbi:MAG: GNAT family N-acetyltransferase [bacterium]|nr:GNAT family N-acetyltransferase [bacterium]
MTQLRLRPLNPARDLDWMYSFLKNESPDGLRQWAGNTLRHPLTPAQLAAHAKRLNVKVPLRRAYIAVARSARQAAKENEIRLAYAELYNITERGSAFITRMVVHPDYRGQGIGPEMLGQILQQGFEKYRLHRIELNVYDFNTAGVRCYEKAGFRKEGLMRGTTFTGRDYWNAYRMAILEDEWRGRPRDPA